jgi:GMP synthase (glutamine-hydrolysing)
MNVDKEDRFPGLAVEAQAFRTAICDGQPVLGSCRCAQRVAPALGGRVCRSSTKAIRWFSVAMHEQARASGFFPRSAALARVFHGHVDTFDLPLGARRLTSSDADRNPPFLVGERMLGLPFPWAVGPDEVGAMRAPGAAELSLSGGTVPDAVTKRRETERHDTEPLLGDALTRCFGAEKH